QHGVDPRRFRVDRADAHQERARPGWSVQPRSHCQAPSPAAVRPPARRSRTRALPGVTAAPAHRAHLARARAQAARESATLRRPRSKSRTSIDALSDPPPDLLYPAEGASSWLPNRGFHLGSVSVIDVPRPDSLWIANVPPSNLMRSDIPTRPSRPARAARTNV